MPQKKPDQKKPKSSARRLVRIAALSAIAFILQVVLANIGLPNVELVSVFFIVIAIVFPKDAVFTAIVFVFLEGLVFGFGIWWVSYLYIWPLLCIISSALSKTLDKNWLLWAIFAAFFGLAFGALTALPYFIIDRSYVITYWIAGIPFDIIHSVSNFVTTLVLAKPLYKLLHMLSKSKKN